MKGRNMNYIHDYSDILKITYQKSSRHPYMSRKERAAQFAPFAALTGHKEVIKETARLTDSKKRLDENQKILVNYQVQEILHQLPHHPYVKITYFQPDGFKQGGHYITIVGNVSKIDEYERIIVLEDYTKILINDIYQIELIS